MKRKFLFIINPITGKYKVDTLRHACSIHLPKDRFEWEIMPTTHGGHAFEVSNSRGSAFDAVVAVGGDGTVNEVASGLLGKSTPIGIIPNGSGNGLARHLTYSMHIAQAVPQLVQASTMKMDIIRVNGKPCFNVAGIGFDAHVAQLFQNSKKRGLISYMWISLREFLQYDHPKILITTDSENKVSELTFSFTLANASQLGNNAVVAKYADLTDGVMDLCLIKKYPVWYLPVATFKLFTQALHRSRYFSGGQSRKVQVELPNTKSAVVQIDGEPIVTSNPVSFEIDPLALNVLMPNN